MQENGAEQPKVYRHTRTFLKIRSTPTDGKAKTQKKEWMPGKENMEFHIPAIPNGNRNLTVKNSQDRSSSSSLTPPLPTLHLPNTQNFSEMREEDGQLAGPLCTSGTTLENVPDDQMHHCNASQQERTLVRSHTDSGTSFMCKDPYSAQRH